MNMQHECKLKSSHDEHDCKINAVQATSVNEGLNCISVVCVVKKLTRSALLFQAFTSIILVVDYHSCCEMHMHAARKFCRVIVTDKVLAVLIRVQYSNLLVRMQYLDRFCRQCFPRTDWRRMFASPRSPSAEVVSTANCHNRPRHEIDER